MYLIFFICAKCFYTFSKKLTNENNKIKYYYNKTTLSKFMLNKVITYKYNFLLLFY